MAIEIPNFDSVDNPAEGSVVIYSKNGEVYRKNSDGNEVSLEAGQDEKVKADANDTSAGYLDVKTDGTTIEVDTSQHKMRVVPGVFAEASHNHNLSNLQDVDNTDKGDGKALLWNDSAGKHVYNAVANANHNHNLSNLADVNATNKADGRVLAWNATNAVHEYVDMSGSGGGAWEVLQKTDVNIMIK